jgi:hypothetical protein
MRRWVRIPPKVTAKTKARNTRSSVLVRMSLLHHLTSCENVSQLPHEM